MKDNMETINYVPRIQNWEKDNACDFPFVRDNTEFEIGGNGRVDEANGMSSRK